MFRDYYAFLEISRDSSSDEIRKAYRLLSKKWHPDRNPGKDTSKEMIDINEAYAILINPENKRKYDVAYDKYMAFVQEQKRRRQVVVGTPNANWNQTADDVYSTKNNAEESFFTDDEELEKEMRASRMKAEDLVSRFMRNLKNDTKVAAKGAAENCFYYFVMIVVINIVVALVVAISK